MEAIRLARRSHAGQTTSLRLPARLAGTKCAAGRAARFDLAESDSIPLAVITAYNRAHPDRPY